MLSFSQTRFEELRSAVSVTMGAFAQLRLSFLLDSASY